MSNRAMIIGGVLAVGLLVALAFALMPDAHTTPVVEDLPQVAKPPPREEPVRAVEAPPPVVDAGVTVDAGEQKLLFQFEAVQGEGALSEAQLAPAVAAVQRIVTQCSKDVEKRYPPPHQVMLTFEVRADGEFATLVQPVVEKSSIQDPHFEACVTDAPLDVQVPLSAVGTARVRLPFRYGRSPE